MVLYVVIYKYTTTALSICKLNMGLYIHLYKAMQLIIQVNVVLLKFHAFNNVTKKFNFAKWNFISWKNVKIQNLNALNVIPFYFSIN